MFEHKGVIKAELPPSVEEKDEVPCCFLFPRQFCFSGGGFLVHSVSVAPSWSVAETQVMMTAIEAGVQDFEEDGNWVRMLTGVLCAVCVPDQVCEHG